MVSQTPTSSFVPRLPIRHLLNPLPSQSPSDTGLPSQWEVRHSNSKNLPYYFNASTKESRWEPPPGTDPEKIKTYMALHHSTPANPSASGAAKDGKIRAAHLLVKHRDSRRPSSWKEPEIRRTKDEALETLRGYEKRIKGGEVSLGDLATSESDCSSARKKGDLGFFGRGDMQKEFEQAAFALKPGEVSQVVDTASGVHLIERLE
ncbi:MAG: protein kinase ssp1 [Alectoria sarmentosa]|nr:MAG: protein kinase ssp1 [Alectoria sarmentosa]